MDTAGDESVELYGYSTFPVFHKEIHKVFNRVIDRVLGITGFQLSANSFLLGTVISFQFPGQLIDEVGIIGIVLNHVLQLLDRMENGRVIPATEMTADLGKGKVGKLPDKVHGGVSGLDERLVLFLGLDV